ncbi:hypothetical protein [Maridesulfovibrio sp.]|uniref:hypothetical protein n=1 Tax=Maridesulfovibrio sp. TaxID=2795000 RepID=UPI0029CA2E73|nr:hypothetical protein [Maridesulfovibrio sp.]
MTSKQDSISEMYMIVETLEFFGKMVPGAVGYMLQVLSKKLHSAVCAVDAGD